MIGLALDSHRTMELFELICLLLAASVSASPLGDNQSSRREDSATSFINISDSPFLKVIKTNDITVRDAIYSTPAVVFVGKEDNKLLRCLYEDPDECEVMFRSDSSFYSLLVSGEYLYAGLYSGQLLRCDPYQKESCKVFQTIDASVDSLAAAGRYFFAGLENGTILRCLHEPRSCRPFHTMGSRVYSLTQVNEYLYAGLLNGNLMRCSLRTENSCIKTQNMDSLVMGVAKTGNKIYTVTWDNHLWNCSLKTNDVTDYCDSVTLKYSYPRGIASFNGVLYMPTNNNGIYTCKGANNTDCSSFGNFKDTRSIAFAYRTYHLQSRYKNEDLTCPWQTDDMCPPTVTYYNAQQRALLEIHVKNNRLYNAFGSLVDTTNANEGRSGKAAIFAMGPDGRISVSNSHKKELLHTSSLFAGSPVSGAGEIVVRNGVVEKMIACSGHYWPDVDLNRQVIESLRTQGYTDSINSLMCGENDMQDDVKVQ